MPHCWNSCVTAHFVIFCAKGVPKVVIFTLFFCPYAYYHALKLLKIHFYSILNVEMPLVFGLDINDPNKSSCLLFCAIKIALFVGILIFKITKFMLKRDEHYFALTICEL